MTADWSENWYFGV